MFYIIRTLRPSGTQVLIADNRAQDSDGEPVRVYGFATSDEAQQRAATVPGKVDVMEFKNDAEARMFLDPACMGFRAQHASRHAAG